MRIPVLLLALALGIPAFAPMAAGHGLPTTAGPLQLYLSSLQVPLGGVGAVEQLLDEAPTKTDDSRRNITGTGAAWYVVSPTPGAPGAARELALGPNVTGVMTFQVELPPGILPIGLSHIDYTVLFDLRSVALSGANATEQSLGRAEVPLTITSQTPIFPPVPGPVTLNWTISLGNATVRAGETLALNISATAASAPAGTNLVGLYDSTGRPSGFNLTLTPVLRGAVQLSTTAASKDAAPGSSPTYVVTVRNAGDATDTVRVNATSSPDWTVRLNPASVTVPAGGTASVLVTVVVPTNATDGTRHTATINAASTNGGTASLVLTTTARAGAVTTPGDADGDGWTDVQERRYQSNPNDANSTPDNTDTDGDGASNRAEVDAGTDPQNPNDFPGSGATNGGAAGAAGCAIVPLCDTFVQSFGMDEATADLASIALIVLFLVVLALLLLLLLGGYPVKVALVAPKAETEPGRGVDYTVEVRSRKGQPQVVDLEVAELPGDWDARLSQPRLSLEARETQTVGLLVRPPDAWPAPSRREFQVRARSRLKPGKFAKAIGRLIINPGAAAPAPPAEEAVPEPAAFPEEAPRAAAATAIAAAPPRAAPSRAGFRVAIRDVRHNPEVPERGSEVTTTARVDNQGAQPERVRVLLVVNGKVRDEVTADLAAGEGAEAEFHWVAYLARNEVKVVAERAP